MEQDILKSVWQGVVITPKTNNEIKNMMRESAHPVLKRIRNQLIIETVFYTLFLLVYYDFFDGDRKSLFANVALVMGMLFAIIHNIFGYVLTRRPATGDTIKGSLQAHLASLKTYAVVSVICRVLVAGCLLLFFTQVIRFTAEKYWLLAGMLLVVVVQVVVLRGIWVKRIKQLKGVVDDFTAL